jgi:hypothetical protein
MLETLALIGCALFVLGLLGFGLRMLLYIASGKYEIDQRIERYCK